MSIEPRAQVLDDPLVAALPKADVHLHHEERVRLDRIVARGRERLPYDWRMWARRLIMAGTPPRAVGRIGSLIS